jgi:hypothetical protein
MSERPAVYTVNSDMGNSISSSELADDTPASALQGGGLQPDGATRQIKDNFNVKYSQVQTGQIPIGITNVTQANDEAVTYHTTKNYHSVPV